MSVPRAGGDEPVNFQCVLPPRRLVFPARAGMNRRSDGLMQTRVLEYVFPARAGMNRTLSSHYYASSDMVFPARAGMNRQASSAKAPIVADVFPRGRG